MCRGLRLRAIPFSRSGHTACTWRSIKGHRRALTGLPFLEITEAAWLPFVGHPGAPTRIVLHCVNTFRAGWMTK